MSGLSSSKVVWLIGTAIAVFPGQAEEFSWQLSGVTSRTEIGDFHTDGWAVDGTYYVNPIGDGAGPYALASFLNPTTRVSAAASRIDSDFFDHPSAYTLDGAYVLPGERWYVGANYAKSDPGDRALNVTRDDGKGYGVLAGRYLGADTTLELGLGRSEHNLESWTCPLGVPCFVGSPAIIPFATETTTNSVSLDVFHVRRFRSLTYSLQGGVSQSEAEIAVVSPDLSLVPASPGDGGSVRAYSVAGELFPTNRLGVRVGYSESHSDIGLDSDGYDVTATWFIKPRIALQFSLSRTSRDDIPTDFADVDNAAVRFIGRL
jgi:hypothetical protein